MSLVLLTAAGLGLLLIGTLVGLFYAPERKPLKRATQEGQSYARSLTDALDGNSSAAIAALTTAIKGNSQTVEAYFALGALFRKRGEHERAVRVHQTIAVRRDIDKATRVRAHFQLGLDFEQAGSRDRAIQAFQWVIANDAKHAEALRELGTLYQQRGAWDDAIAAYRKLGKLKDEGASGLVAHLLAQLAYQGLQSGHLNAAGKALRQAMSARSTSAHVLFVLGEYQRRSNNLAAASNVWQRAVACAPDLVAFFVPHIEAVLFELKRVADLGKMLSELVATHPQNAHLRLALARFDAKRDPEQALRTLGALIDDFPHLLPARRQAAELILKRGDVQAVRRSLAELLDVVGRAERGYRCSHCGHTAAEMSWRCGSCGRWETVTVMWGRRATEATGAA